MEELTIKHLIELFSKARLEPYLKGQSSFESVIGKYHFNIELSAAMMPMLHYLEVCLRNRLDQLLTTYYGPEWLLHLPEPLLITEQDKVKVAAIVRKLQKKIHKSPLHDDIVAQMNFGFWFAFFHRRYDPILWHRKDALKFVFPNLPRNKRRRVYVEQKLFQVKEIRNRIAHHEPIWNINSTTDAYNSGCELIKAMSVEGYKLLKEIDCFPNICKKL